MLEICHRKYNQIERVFMTEVVSTATGNEKEVFSVKEKIKHQLRRRENRQQGH